MDVIRIQYFKNKMIYEDMNEYDFDEYMFNTLMLNKDSFNCISFLDENVC